MNTLESYQKLIREASGDAGLLEGLVNNAFKYLAEYMHKKKMRDAFEKMKADAGLPDDLYVHVLGCEKKGKGATITLFTDDLKAFHAFFADPEEFVATHGYVHLSDAMAIY